jgi:hypothetical protein
MTENDEISEISTEAQSKSGSNPGGSNHILRAKTTLSRRIK